MREKTDYELDLEDFEAAYKAAWVAEANRDPSRRGHPEGWDALHASLRERQAFEGDDGR